jgi:predicted metal-dependent HD superfamily phosphohydrolase
MSETPVTRQIIEALLCQVNLKGKEVHVIQMSYDIINSYGESFRHYHTLEHIADCFQEFEEVKKHFTKPTLAKFALLYHDIIYIPGYQGNEDASAARAELDAYRLGLERQDRKYITDCVSITAHPICISSKDQEFVHDIDYSILGQDREKFLKYEDGIRKEFSAVNDENAYRQGRLEFLARLSNLVDNIYLTDHFHKKYEKKSRENINYSIKLLSRGK